MVTLYYFFTGNPNRNGLETVITATVTFKRETKQNKSTFYLSKATDRINFRPLKF